MYDSASTRAGKDVHLPSSSFFSNAMVREMMLCLRGCLCGCGCEWMFGPWCACGWVVAGLKHHYVRDIAPAYS